MKLPKIDPVAVNHPYPETTMFGAISASADRFPKAPAYEFMGKYTTYTEFVKKIELAAGAFYKAGIRKNDVVAICMPNTPQALICMYALNRIGAIANMIHPLSSKKNITYYLDYADSKMILCLDQFYEKVRDAVAEAKREVRILVARISEELPAVLAAGYALTQGKPYRKFPDSNKGVVWSDFIRAGRGVKLPIMPFR